MSEKRKGEKVGAGRARAGADGRRAEPARSTALREAGGAAGAPCLIAEGPSRTASSACAGASPHFPSPPASMRGIGGREGGSERDGAIGVRQQTAAAEPRLPGSGAQLGGGRRR